MRLDLRTPLTYADAPELVPFTCQVPDTETAGELLFCFELDAAQAGRIDPEPECFLGPLVFAGRNGHGKEHELPAGLYLFAQQRKNLNRTELIDMAIEQQKDGLWERHKPGTLLYIRCLYEDGSPVTQLFRPCL